jgi:hypothetical protein
MDNKEGRGRVDIKHCYACCDALKHPRDGVLYHGGHIGWGVCCGFFFEIAWQFPLVLSFPLIPVNCKGCNR